MHTSAGKGFASAEAALYQVHRLLDEFIDCSDVLIIDISPPLQPRAAGVSDQARHDARCGNAWARRAEEGRWHAPKGMGSRCQAESHP